MRMNKYNEHHIMPKFDLQKFENIEDKKIIHQFENKNLTIELEALKDKYILNKIR